MNKKAISMLMIVVIVVIIVVVAGIAVYVLYFGGEGEPEPTPTPTPTNPVEGATSMRFDVEVKFEGELLEMDLFTTKNLGTSDIQLRVDQTDKDQLEFIYIMNQTAQKAWAAFMGEWTEAEDFSTYWDSTLIGQPALNSYMAALANWSGTGNHEFSAGDYSYVISNIAVNPDIPDSAFEHG